MAAAKKSFSQLDILGTISAGTATGNNGGTTENSATTAPEDPAPVQAEAPVYQFYANINPRQDGVKSRRFNALLPENLYQELTTASERTGVSRNEIACQALRAFLRVSSK